MDGRRRAEVQAQRGGGQRVRGPFRGSPVPPRIVDGRSAGRVGAAYLAAAPHVPVRQLVGQQGGGKEEEGFQGGSVRAWYMVVRAKRCQPQLSDSVDARRTEGTDGNRNKGKRKDNSVDNNKHPRVRGL